MNGLVMAQQIELVLIKIYIECLKQNNRMGNHVPPGIPVLLAKNWQPVPDHPNSFRNKLTSQYTHKHIINIEHPMEIESFKNRMKETNVYICRVLFYHQYHESIYHVYTDEIHIQPIISKPEIWRAEKIKIVQSFAQLAHTYGYMKVCRQMIGADTNQHVKIWIHPDPVSAKPWSPCNSEAVMLSDILTALQGIQDKASQRDKKNMSRFLVGNSTTQYTSFQQYITRETNLLEQQYSQNRSRANRSSSILQNFQNIQNNIKQINDYNQSKKHFNKTFAFPSQIQESRNDQQYQSGLHKQPRLSSDQYPNQYAKNNKLQKLFSPVLCETSRDEQEKSKMKPKPHPQPQPQPQPHQVSFNNSYRVYQNRKNLSLERPTTHYAQVPTPKIQQDYIKAGGGFDSPKRRQTENFKLLNLKAENGLKGKQESSKSSVYLKSKESDNKMSGNFRNPKQSNKSQFAKLLVQPPVLPMNQEQVKFNKTYHVPLNLRHQNPQQHSKSRLKSQIGFKKDYKQTPIPNFLIKSAQLEQDLASSNKGNHYQKYPSTQRQQREGAIIQEKYKKNLEKTGLNIISAKSIGESSEGQTPVEIQNRVRKNTAARLKEELNFILETPIERSPRPVSQDFQNFKSKKLLYRNSEMNHSTESEKEEIDVIKYKVEEKKAKFAQLKTDARKILEDDF